MFKYSLFKTHSQTLNGITRKFMQRRPITGGPAASAPLYIPSEFSACCGAKQTSNWGGYFDENNKKFSVERQKQDWLVTFLSNFPKQMTMYSICTDAQINAHKHGHLALLLEMGMKVVDSRPNQNHLGNNMCMLVWCPQDHMNKLNMYVKYNSNGEWEPLWYTSMTEEQKNEYYKTDEVKEFETLDAQELEASKKALQATYIGFVRTGFMYFNHLTQESKDGVMRYARDLGLPFATQPILSLEDQRKLAYVKGRTLNELDGLYQGNLRIIKQEEYVQTSREIQRLEAEVSNLKEENIKLSTPPKKVVRKKKDPLFVELNLPKTKKVKAI